MKRNKEIQFCQFTDIGLVREHNEDYYTSAEINGSIVFVVCDGMGGLDKGEEAARLAGETVLDFFQKNASKPEFWLLENSIRKANKVVYNLTQKTASTSRMGTTLVVALFRNNKLFYAHIGDSRIYLIRKNTIEQLTRDHSYVEDLVQNKIITKEEARIHPRKNEINRAIGLYETVEPELCEKPIPLNKGEIVLLCTDGLTDMVDDETLLETISSEFTLDEKGKTLIEKAKKGGGKDNISLTLVESLKSNKSREIRLWLYGVILLGIFLSLFYFLKCKDNKKELGLWQEETQQKPWLQKIHLPEEREISFDVSCIDEEGTRGREVINLFSMPRDYFIEVTTEQVSVEEELEYGRKFHKAYIKKEEVKENKGLTSILNNLVSKNKSIEYRYKIYEVDSEEINALTFGARIYVFKGMLDFVDSKEELAAVVAHEVAHNELGHINSSLRLNKTTSKFLGEDISGFLLYIENMLAQPFNQKDEVMADLLGADLMLRAGYNSCKAIDLWQRMSESEEKINVVNELLSSHPYSIKRAKCIQNHLFDNYKLTCD